MNASTAAHLRQPIDLLADPLDIPAVHRPFDVTVRPPGSKSITNRALLLAALADGTSELIGPLIDADDAQVMLRAIQQLGATIELRRAGKGKLDVLRIAGVGGRWKVRDHETVTLNLKNAGTATRFLTAAAMLAPPGAQIVIDGDERMRERPIGELSNALRQLGIHVEHLGRDGYPPLRITAPSADTPLADRVEFGRTASSQFISAMMMALPLLDADVGIVLTESPTSASYIRMTEQVMRDVGFEFHPLSRPTTGDPRLYRTTLRDHRLPAFTYAIEPDASGATYFLAAAAMIPGARCIIDGLPWVAEVPLQGDTWFGGVIHAAGARQLADATSTEVIGADTLAAFEWDFRDMPDTAMTAAVLAACASPTAENPTATSTFHGLRTLRVKETDRLTALKTELEKIGAKVSIFSETLDGVPDEGLRITASPECARDATTADHETPRVEFDTYNDHRMAMALSLIGLRRPNVHIRNPKCVAKTYPTFFAELARLY